MENNLKKNYRKNVAAIILSHKYPLECKFFIASRIDLPNIWQFPQGGIDEGETQEEALFRELKEEIGTNDVEIIAKHPEWLSYDFSPNAKKRMLPYDGQIQKYFLVKLNSYDKINIDTKHPEFGSYVFVDYSALLKKIPNFKKSIYTEVLKFFKKEGYL
jgi:putative (di)nucleoside polyphosphate hydrolase